MGYPDNNALGLPVATLRTSRVSAPATFTACAVFNNEVPMVSNARPEARPDTTFDAALPIDLRAFKIGLGSARGKASTAWRQRAIAIARAGMRMVAD